MANDARHSLLRRFDRPIVTVPPEAAMAVGPRYRLRQVLVLADRAADSPALGISAAAVVGRAGAAAAVMAIDERHETSTVADHVRAGLRSEGLKAEVSELRAAARDLDDVRRVIAEAGVDLVLVGGGMQAGAPQIRPIATALIARAQRPVMVVPSMQRARRPSLPPLVTSSEAYTLT